MYMNGIITREEIEEVKNALNKTQKATNKASIFYNIFLILYTMALLFLLFHSVYYKQELIILECAFAGTVTVFWWKNHFKRRKQRKHINYTENTDKILEYPQEYIFSTDDEKICVNDTAIIKFLDISVISVTNGYTVLSSSDKKSVILTTDNEQQMYFYNYCVENKIPVFTFTLRKKERFSNKQLLAVSSEIMKKHNRKEVIKELLIASAITLAVYVCILIIGSVNGVSARDKNQYYYDENAGEYFTSQMSEKYSETKSYKALMDIYFDWAAKETKTVIAIKKENNVATDINIFYRNNSGVPYRITYTHSPDFKTRKVSNDFVLHWENEIRALSNYQTLAKKYPYIIDVMSVLGFDMELILKDKSIFTQNDNIYIFFTPAFYSCGNDNEHYTIHFVEKTTKDADVILSYFNRLQDECSMPYDDQKISDWDIFYQIESWSGIDVVD